MKKTAVLALISAFLLSLIAFAQEDKPYPKTVQRDKALKMKDLLFKVQHRLAADEEEEALKAYKELEKLYSDVQAGRITNKSYKQQMIEMWDLAQEKLYPVLREIELKKARKKQQEKPQEKPEEKPYPLTKQRECMLQMQETLCKIYQHLADGNNDKALESYEKLEELYRDVERGRITDKKYKDKMRETWNVAQEKVLPKLEEIRKKQSEEKVEEKPAPKPEDKTQKPSPKPEKESDKPEPKSEEKKEKFEGAEYYPLETGLAWTYRSGKAEALVNISRVEKFKGHDCFVVETISGVKLQQRRWLYVTDKGIYVAKDLYKEKKKTVEVEYDPPFPVAKFPFKQGQKWKWVGKNAAGRTISFTAEVKGTKTVTVPAGTFTGLEVVTLRNVGGYVQKISEVLVPGVGLVYLEKEIIKMRGGKDKRTLELVKYTKPEGEKKQDKPREKKDEKKDK